MVNDRKFVIQKPSVSVSQNSQERKKNFVITKKIAKHGSQAIIVIPRVLEEHLKPGTIVQITMDILDKFVEEGK